MPIEFRQMNVLGLRIGGDQPANALPGNISVLLLLLLSFTVFNYLYNGIFRPLFTEKVDFEAYYNGAMAFRHGLPVYQNMVDFFQAGPYQYKGPLPYVYPPAFVIFLSPLSYVSFSSAVVLWIFFNQILFFTGLFFLIKTIARRYSWIELSLVVFVCMNFTPLFVDYLIGQCNIILFFLIALGLYMYRSNRPVYAGIALALACVIKVIPLLLLLYGLWKRQYKVFVAGMLTLFFIFIYSLLFFDADLLLWYMKFMMNQTLFDAFHDNHSLTGFFSRFLSHSMWIRGVFDSPFATRISIILSSLLVLGVFLFATRKKSKPSDRVTLHEYALAVTTMLLLSKMTSTPYLVMLLVPLAILVKEIFEYAISVKWLVILGVGYGMLATWYPLPVGKFLNMDNYSLLLNGFPANIFSFQFLAVAVLWCYFAFATPPLRSSNGKMDVSE